MLLTQPFLNNLLHRLLALFRRRLDLRCRRRWQRRRSNYRGRYFRARRRRRRERGGAAGRWLRRHRGCRNFLHRLLHGRRRRFLFNLGFNLWFGLNFDFRNFLWRFDVNGLGWRRRGRRRSFDLHFLDRRGCRDLLCSFKHTQFLPQSIRQAVLNCIRMGRHWHAHVLQFANNLRIIAIQLTRQLINSKLWHSLLTNLRIVFG